MRSAQDDVVRTMLSSNNFALIGAGQLGDIAISLWPSYLPSPSVVLDSNKTGKCQGINIEKMKELEPENSKLKRMYADMALENQAIKDLLGKL